MKVLQLYNRHATPGGEDRVADDEADLLAAVATFAGAVCDPRQVRAIKALGDLGALACEGETTTPGAT